MDDTQRCARFEVAIMAIQDEYDDDFETCIIDLLTDARHWCHLNDRSFEDLDRMAREHFEAEVNEQLSEERKRP
jgi:hypothetical protein